MQTGIYWIKRCHYWPAIEININLKPKNYYNKTKFSLYSRYYAEALNERTGGGVHRRGNTARKKRRSRGEPLATVSDLAGQEI